LDDLQQGSSTPLAAGDYSFWLQETGSTTVDYQISFTTAVVPEPSTYVALLGSAAIALAVARRRKRQ
ncbi:MAG: PEP-CTERM sorting domain-containing protein, partial [Verrucomicrobiota bacterium]